MTNFLFGWFTKGHCDVSAMDTTVGICWLVVAGFCGLLIYSWLVKK